MDNGRAGANSVCKTYLDSPRLVHGSPPALLHEGYISLFRQCPCSSLVLGELIHLLANLCLTLHHYHRKNAGGYMIRTTFRGVLLLSTECMETCLAILRASVLHSIFRWPVPSRLKAIPCSPYTLSKARTPGNWKIKVAESSEDLEAAWPEPHADRKTFYRSVGDAGTPKKR